MSSITECSVSNYEGHKIYINTGRIGSQWRGFCQQKDCERYLIGQGDITVAPVPGSPELSYVLSCGRRPDVSYEEMVRRNRLLDGRST